MEIDANAQKIVRVYGTAGTGKTTYLIQRIDDLLSKGVNISEIGFMTFSRKAREEMITRLLQKYGDGYKREDFVWFNTCHATGYKLLNAKPTQMFINQRLSAFFEENNIEYAPLHINVYNTLDYDIFDYNVASFQTSQIEMWGNLFVDCYSKEKCGMDIDDFLDDGRCITSSFAKEDYENIKKKYLQYKRDHLLLDFSDLLEIPVDCSMELPIKYLFIDEEQDLNIAQQKFIQCVSQNCKEIIYAGDDYQKIYGFMGATGCGTLISQKNIEVVILNTTYRIPSKIWRVITDFAKNNILNKAYSLDEIKSSRLGGNISFTADFQKIMDVVKNINDPCLFLLRTNKQKQIVKMKLMDEGIPFMDAVENSAWTQKLINISNAIYQLKVLNASPSELKLKMTDLIDVLPQKEYLIRGVKAKFDNNEGIDYSQIFNLNFWGSNSNMITNHLNISDNQSLALNRFWEQPKIIKNINVSIGTIHSYKGGEAKNVFLCVDLPFGVRKSFEDCSNEKQKQNKLDDEARVFFVGITRASDNLVLYSTTLKENYLDLWGVDVSTLC